jgi:hypothetical protein
MWEGGEKNLSNEVRAGLKSGRLIEFKDVQFISIEAHELGALGLDRISQYCYAVAEAR